MAEPSPGWLPLVVPREEQEGVTFKRLRRPDTPLAAEDLHGGSVEDREAFVRMANLFSPIRHIADEEMRRPVPQMPSAADGEVAYKRLHEARMGLGTEWRLDPVNVQVFAVAHQDSILATVQVMTHYARNAKVQVEGLMIIEGLLQGKMLGTLDAEALSGQARLCLRAEVARRVVAVMHAWVRRSHIREDVLITCINTLYLMGIGERTPSQIALTKDMVQARAIEAVVEALDAAPMASKVPEFGCNALLALLSGGRDEDDVVSRKKRAIAAGARSAARRAISRHSTQVCKTLISELARDDGLKLQMPDLSLDEFNVAAYVARNIKHVSATAYHE